MIKIISHNNLNLLPNQHSLIHQHLPLHKISNPFLQIFNLPHPNPHPLSQQTLFQSFPEFSIEPFVNL